MRTIGDTVTYFLDGDGDQNITGVIVALPTPDNNQYIITGNGGWELSFNEEEYEGYVYDHKLIGTPCWYVEESDIRDEQHE